ncbi:YeeE/YedE family protein [Nisaea acidiphila]|uniref:YeeE/YedE family protein n=1 Tax=Nisaea acidiphila TaxID=1862145 RepID=A0A9J7AUY8_9PROT|nr:YeeE/YedE family protein [Nisaea acidiphila]UUX51143.1 YeeE/YedE family protein [Nisaea acidiphila]
MSSILLAIVIGGAFGFTLDRVGATNPNFIIRMLNLTNLHLMRTILLAIGVAALLTFGGLLSGLVDPGHLSVKDAYLGVFVGGVLLGLGFAVAGYCPGTGLAAAASGRFDAMVFVLGGLAGAFGYMVTYADVKASGMLDKILGGKATLGNIAGTSYPVLMDIPGELVGLVLGAAFIAIAWFLPDRIVGAKNRTVAAE